MKIIDRMRSRRDAVRRSRDLERALRSTNSHAVRQEIIAISSRFQ